MALKQGERGTEQLSKVIAAPEDRPKNVWFVKLDHKNIEHKYNLKRKGNVKDIIIKITDIDNMTMNGVDQYDEVPLTL